MASVESRIFLVRALQQGSTTGRDRAITGDGSAGVLMLRSSRASSGAFAVIFACSFAGACSSTGSGSHAAAGAASGGGDSASAGNDASAAGDSPVDANASGASSSGVNRGGASSGGVGSSRAGSENDSGSAGASGTSSVSSGARRIFYLDVQGRVLTFDEDKPIPRTLVSSPGQGPDGIAVDVAGGHLFWTTMG